MKKILVVDDDKSTRNLLEAVFSSQGYRVKVAESGESAIKYLGQECFNIIVSDINMPYMNGNDLVKACKKLKEKIPVVALTGEKEGVCDLFDLVLKKPFDVTNLIQAIKQFLS